MFCSRFFTFSYRRNFHSVFQCNCGQVFNNWIFNKIILVWLLYVIRNYTIFFYIFFADIGSLGSTEIRENVFPIIQIYFGVFKEKISENVQSTISWLRLIFCTHIVNCVWQMRFLKFLAIYCIKWLLRYEKFQSVYGFSSFSVEMREGESGRYCIVF